MQVNEKQVMKQLGDYEYNPSYCVGEGAFGKVYRGKKKSTNQIVAIKRMDSAQINKDEYLKQSLRQEVQILKTLDCVNIVRQIDFFETQTSAYLITEFCEDGDLRSYSRKACNSRGINEQEVIAIFRQLVNGFRLLVEKNIIHRDIKPANILISRGVFKIADFGFAKILENNYEAQLLRTCVGSPLYMSPQILMRQKYTTKSDIWSLGIIYYELLHGSAPFGGRDEKQLLENIKTKTPSYPKPLNEFSKQFLSGALEFDEDKRMPWDRIFTMFKGPAIQAPIVKRQDEEEEQIVAPVIRKQSSTDQTKQIQAEKQENAFRHFVNIELLNKLNIATNLYKKELQFETLCIMLAKSNINRSTQLLEKSKRFTPNLTSVIQQELDQHQSFLKDILAYFDRMGYLHNIKQQQDFKLADFKDRTNDLESELAGKITSIVQTSIKKLGADTLKGKETYEYLNLLDYLLDIVQNMSRLSRQLEIDYSTLHDKAGPESNPLEYVQRLNFKLQQPNI